MEIFDKYTLHYFFIAVFYFFDFFMRGHLLNDRSGCENFNIVKRSW